MNKQTVSEFVLSLLRQAELKGIQDWGTSLTSSCPFHGNRKNFKTFRVSTVETINRKTGLPGYYFNCFSCGQGGTIVTLIAHILGCTRKKALRIFEKRTDVSSITVDILVRDLEKFSESAEDTELVPVEMPPMGDRQGPMLKYLKMRNRSHGFWNINYLVEKYELYYCAYGRMAGRIIMPIRDTDGKVVCYNDRAVDERAERKSLHVKDFPYGKLLHGLYESIGKKYVVLTEGSFDMFAVDCALLGTKHEKKFGVVNMMGVAFTDDRFNLLVKNFDKIYLMLDNDEAGTRMATEIAEQHGGDIDIKDCGPSYPEEKDPALCTKAELIRAIRVKPIVKRSGYLEYLTRKLG